MLYYIFDFLEQKYESPGAELFQFLSFRAGLAIILSLGLVLLLGNPIINRLRRKLIGETVRDLGLRGQKVKQGTPTMGGLIIIGGILIPSLLINKLDNIYIIMLLVTTAWMALIGFADDYIKVFKKDKGGLKGRFKIIGQVMLGIFIGVTMMLSEDIQVRVPIMDAKDNNYDIVREAMIDVPTLAGKPMIKRVAYVDELLTNVPFIKKGEFNYSSLAGGSKLWSGILYTILIILIIVSVSNGSNLTDGLDGLLTGCAAIIGAAVGIFAYVSGNAITADYLGILFIPEAGEVLVFAACFLGACIGFLWFNAFPAKVFMGDTGSLAIGSIIAVIAIILRKELLIPILCGIFLIENLSVVLQVSYFKYTKKKTGEGKRIFLMSPLHHHYQKKGMHEVTIVTRFWIVCIFLAILAIITLKVR